MCIVDIYHKLCCLGYLKQNILTHDYKVAYGYKVIRLISIVLDKVMHVFHV